MGRIGRWLLLDGTYGTYGTYDYGTMGLWDSTPHYALRTAPPAHPAHTKGGGKSFLSTAFLY